MLLHRVCISPTAVVLCYSSELPTLVLGLLTTLHTLQMWPPYLLRDGFSPIGLATEFHQPRDETMRLGGCQPLPPVTTATLMLESSTGPRLDLRFCLKAISPEALPINPSVN